MFSRQDGCRSAATGIPASPALKAIQDELGESSGNAGEVRELREKAAKKPLPIIKGEILNKELEKLARSTLRRPTMQ